MTTNSKIVVFGGTGLVGSAILRKLVEKGYKNILATYHRSPITDHRSQITDRGSQITFIQIDLTDQQSVVDFFKTHKPEYVFLAAAKVGGIWANNVYRADFIYQNLQIQNNVIHQSYLNKVKKLLFLGSTCIYPKNCPQPIKEEYLLTAPLEYTNEPYAIAKIAGIKMCESYNLQYGANFISVMPTNLYGLNDNFDLEKSHVLPALIRKIHLGKCLEENNWDEIRRDLNKRPIEGIDGNANEDEILRILDKYGIKITKSDQLSVISDHFSAHYSPITDHRSQITDHQSPVSIEIWGTGKPKREFLWSDDMADACIFIMENVDFKDVISDQLSVNSKQLTAHSSQITEIRNTHINIGTGKDISIKDLAYLIKDIIGFRGEFYFNTNKPDGTMRKVTDVSKLHSLGWRHKVELEEGIRELYYWYKKE
ncbi:GDP-L-fucose synthase [Deferribacter autotrophicus]|uniref:GDP-L-fucose synthase n=1 Tax=Deferribacter autotrophicus TaxID=500465 RepID=A0A5A8F3H3_9BACT|nr:GDP-L-fucose synthase [Deferribacter autotrophicus]